VKSTSTVATYERKHPRCRSCCGRKRRPVYLRPLDWRRKEATCHRCLRPFLLELIRNKGAAKAKYAICLDCREQGYYYSARYHSIPQAQSKIGNRKSGSRDFNGRDPERVRAYNTRYHAEHREAILERKRVYFTERGWAALCIRQRLYAGWTLLAARNTPLARGKRAGLVPANYLNGRHREGAA